MECTTPREAFVVGNDALPKGKDIHGAILYCPWAAVVGERQQEPSPYPCTRVWISLTRLVLDYLQP